MFKARLVKILVLVAWLSCLAGYAFVMRSMMLPGEEGIPESDTMMLLQKAGTVLLIAAAVFTCVVFYVLIIKSSLVERSKNVLLTATILFLMLLGGECFFLNYPRSNAIGERWSYKLWDRKYIRNRTAFYYTDSKGDKQRADLREPLPASPPKKKSAWFIGDSFTFGFGLEETSQTFPAVVEEKMNGKLQCINLGDGGADTYKEKETLFAYDSVAGYKPAVVVWQYFGNDIDTKDEGPDLFEKQRAKDAWTILGRQFFQAKSFLLDFIYWQFFTRNESGTIDTYGNFLNKLYSSDNSNAHLAPLKQAADYYKSKGVKFLVVIFPFLWEGGPEDAQRLYAQKLETELRDDSTDVINLAPLLKVIPTKERIVNVSDPHPSASAARMTGDTIARYFKIKYGW